MVSGFLDLGMESLVQGMTIDGDEDGGRNEQRPQIGPRGTFRLRLNRRKLGRYGNPRNLEGTMREGSRFKTSPDPTPREL